MTVSKQDLVPLALLLITVYSKRAVCFRIPSKEVDGCRQTTEIGEFHLQGEAVALRFSKLEVVLAKLGLTNVPEFTYHATSGNRTNLRAESTDRVRTQGLLLWFLPALTADSGNYTCVFRNASYCISGTISLQVYESKDPHLDMISYLLMALPGNTGIIPCPNIHEFNNTGNLQWFKESIPIALTAEHTRYHQPLDIMLVIEDVSLLDEGFYTCELWVLVNHSYYKVTRTTKLEVLAPNAEPTTTTIAASQSPVRPPALQPKIIYPSNSDIFESAFGSSLEIPCRVLTENDSADSTQITWLVDGMAVEDSVLRGRVYLDDRVTKGINGSYVELILILLEFHEEDTSLEIKCIAQNPGGRQEVIAQIKLQNPWTSWLLVGAVGTTAFFTVVSVFLYHTLKHQKNDYAQRKNYMLARQDSMF